jgi:hypothetical protein
MAIAALGLIVTALVESPGGYAFNQVPSVMLKTVLRVFE